MATSERPQTHHVLIEIDLGPPGLSELHRNTILTGCVSLGATFRSTHHSWSQSAEQCTCDNTRAHTHTHTYIHTQYSHVETLPPACSACGAPGLREAAGSGFVEPRLLPQQQVHQEHVHRPAPCSTVTTHVNARLHVETDRHIRQPDRTAAIPL